MPSTLIVDDLIPLDKKLSLFDIEKIREVSLNEPLLKNLLISADGRTTAVSATLNLPFKSVDEVPNAYKVAEEIAQKYKELYPGRLVVLGDEPLHTSAQRLFPLRKPILNFCQLSKGTPWSADILATRWIYPSAV